MGKKTKRNIIIASLLVVIAVIGVIAYMTVKDLKQEDILCEEVKAISEKDVTKDRYNTEVKTTKDYAVVEKAIKNYMDEYATTLQDLLKILVDEKLVNSLSAANYQKDGPDFVETKNYLEETKIRFNQQLEKLTDMTSEKTIVNNIAEKKLDSYYIELYKELMLNGIAEKDFEQSKKDLKIASEKINKVLNCQTEVINLLVANKGKWEVQGDKIVFQDTATLNRYNELVNSIK